MADEDAYIAKCKCGGVVMACSTNHAEDAAKEVSDCIKAGFSIERMAAEDVRTAKWCNNRGNCKSGEKGLYEN